MQRGPYPARAIPMSDCQISILKAVANKATASQQDVTRSKILLLAQQGRNNSEVKRTLGVSLNTVKTWRSRWEIAYPTLLEAESAVQSGQMAKAVYRQEVLKAIADKARSGAPKRITLAEEQQLIALACDKPIHHGHPVTDWTHEMLAKTAITKQMIDTISSTQVGRILKKMPITTS